MASFNKVVIMGNLTRDPEMRHTAGGTAVCELSMAVNRKFSKDGITKEEVSYIDVKLWGRTAEIAAQYLAKGRPVLVEGRLQQETWDDKATGAKRSKLIVVGETMQLLSGGERGSGGEAKQPSRQSRSPADSFYDPPTSTGQDADEDVPF